MLLAFLLILIHTAHPEVKTSVEGYFPDAAGEEIRLMKYDDLLSYKTAEVNSAHIDENGRFQMDVEISKAQLMFFRYRHGQRSLYLDPGKSYEIEFKTAGSDDFDETRSLHPMHQGFDLEVRNPEGQEDINYWINRINNRVADYLETHVMHRPRTNHRNSLNNFIQETDSVLADLQHLFVTAYKEYYYGYLEATLNTRSFQHLFLNYIAEREILYHNPMYMDLFSTLFGSYVFTGSRFITRRDLDHAVNTEADYYVLMDTLSKDTILSDERLRELVMLASLQEMLSISEYSNQQVFRILRYAAGHALYDEHRRIASNILARRKNLKPGYPAPEIVLKDGEGRVVFDLSEKKGSYVYLFFWAGWCPVSMAEIGPMADIATRFQDGLSAIGILVDSEESVSQVSGRDSVLPFDVFHYAGDYRMLDRYQVRSIPRYILIDPDGNIYDNPFPAPSAGVSNRLERIINR